MEQQHYVGLVCALGGVGATLLRPNTALDPVVTGQPAVVTTRPLFDLRDDDVADHHFRHSAGKLQNVVSHPVGGFRVRRQRGIGTVKQADGDHDVFATIDQIVALKSFQFAHQRHKALSHTSCPLRCGTTSHPIFSNGDEHFQSLRQHNGDVSYLNCSSTSTVPAPQGRSRASSG